MASVRQRLLDLTSDVGFPVDKATLLALAERSHDYDVVDVVTGLHDQHYASAAELEHRLDDALGVPDALPDESAIAPSDGWAGDAEDDG